MKKKYRKFRIGLVVLSVIALSAFAVIFRYGDVNLTGSLIEMSRETEIARFSGANETIRDDASEVSRYGNKIYHYIFAAFLVYGFFNRKNKKKRKYLRVALIYIVVQIIASGFITEGLKRVVGRPRPEVAMEEGYRLKPFSGRTSYQSFPSGHASDAFASAGVVWMFSSSPIIIASSFAYSGFIALSRVLRGRHYLLDITFGMIIGFLTALFIMHKKYEEDGG